MSLKVGQAGGPMVQGGDPVPARAVTMLAEFCPCWLQATLMATSLSTLFSHKPAPSWPETTAPSHIGREEPGSSLPTCSLVLGIWGRKAQPAMSPTPLRALAQGGKSQQCQNASCCPFSSWARGKVLCPAGATGSRTCCGQQHSALAASTTLLFLQSPLCAGDSSPPGSFASCMSSCCKLAAGHGDSPQPRHHPTSQRLTVSLGCTRCWNELKASWECLRKPGMVPALPCALWFPRTSPASWHDCNAPLPALGPACCCPAHPCLLTSTGCPRAPPAGASSSLQVLPALALPACMCPAILLASALLPGPAPRLTVRGPPCSKGSLFLSAAPTLPIFAGFPSLGLSLFPLTLLPVFSCFPSLHPAAWVPRRVQPKWFAAHTSSPFARLFPLLSLPPAYSTSDTMGLFFFPLVL